MLSGLNPPAQSIEEINEDITQATLGLCKLFPFNLEFLIKILEKFQEHSQQAVLATNYYDHPDIVAVINKLHACVTRYTQYHTKLLNDGQTTNHENPFTYVRGEALKIIRRIDDGFNAANILALPNVEEYKKTNAQSLPQKSQAGLRKTYLSYDLNADEYKSYVLDYCLLPAKQLTGKNISGCSLHQAIAPGANLAGTKFDENTNLSKSFFYNSMIDETTSFKGVNVEGAVFIGLHFPNEKAMPPDEIKNYFFNQGAKGTPIVYCETPADDEKSLSHSDLINKFNGLVTDLEAANRLKGEKDQTEDYVASPIQQRRRKGTGERYTRQASMQRLSDFLDVQYRLKKAQSATAEATDEDFGKSAAQTSSLASNGESKLKP